MSASVDVLPHRPSLLDRRASSNYTDLPDHLSVSDLFASAVQPAVRPAAARGASRKHPAAFLPFVPLTPIMASPLLTPDIAHASSPAAVLEGAARQSIPGHNPPQRQDYLSHHVSPPHPTWTTSPPTPPPKSSSPSPRVVASTSSSPIRVGRGRSKSHSKASRSRSTSTTRSGPRPASLASYTPTPLSRSYSPSPSPSLHIVRPAPPVTGLSARRLSLPADLHKPLPPRPSPTPDGAPADMCPVIDDADDANEGALLPSLSRRAARSGAPAIADPGETIVSRGRARKLFSLDDEEGEGDLSDSEDRERDALSREKRGVQKEAAPRAQMAEERTLDPERERERAERVRRYHALMELLTTEVGYLLDLRTLVTVYLDQLLLLSSPSQIAVAPAPLGPSGLPTPPLAQPLSLRVPVPSSGRSMSSLSALSIPSIFPSSRSSFLHNSSAPSSYPSMANIWSLASPDAEDEDSTSGERTRENSGASTSTESSFQERDKEREHEKENLERIQPLKQSKSSRQQTSVLTEKEVRVVYRNAREMLIFHERFVAELRAAVGLIGFGMMLSGDEAWLAEMHGDGEGVIADLVDHAVEVVTTKFINEAASFSIYETFCPGHAAATDLIRRAQERWPAVWDVYEQRCALLLARHSEHPPLPHHRGLSDNTVATTQTANPASGEALASDGPMRKKRRHSTPTLSLSSSFASLHGAAASPSQLPFPSASSPGSATLPPPTATACERLRTAGPKLKFMDYLIKPVQRICKYPLLLDQLRPKRRDADSVQQAAAEEAVRRAGEAMRRVVSRVNRASEKEAHNLRSALIASRIAFAHSPSAPPQSMPSSAPSTYPSPPPTAPSSSSGSSSSHGHGTSSASSCTSSPAIPIPPSATIAASLPPLTVPSQRPSGLTAEFVSSLGPCMLAGALDVIQHPAHRAKYLGTFLYAGGYCVLVKITKGGRVYEPRHWFPFSAVEVVDVEEDDPSFPYSFHVTAQGCHLQLAAACAQEKAFWLSAITDSLKSKPSWVREPLSTFQADQKTPLSATADDPLQDSPPGLPAIQSLSDLEKQTGGSPHAADAMAGTPTSRGQLKYTRTLSRLDNAALRQDSHPPVTISAALSRRSSTASVKAFFTPFDSTRPTRPSSQVRAQVEQGLHDIFSESCLAARSQTQMRGEDLFSARVQQGSGSGMGKRQGSGIPRSNSGISIANAMGLTAAKRRYDNVLVSRRKASVEGIPDLPVPGESASPGTEMSAGVGAAPGPGIAGRAKSLAVRRHKKQPASIAPAITTAIAQLTADTASGRRGSLVQSPEALSLDSPPAVSHCSSMSSRPTSMLSSPTEAAVLPIPISGLSPNGTLRQSDILQVRAEDAMPKRSRSMVSHVRNIFHQRRSDSASSASPSNSDHGHVSEAPPQLPPLQLLESPTSEYPSGIVQWLRRTSLRRLNSSSSDSHSTEEQHNSKRPLPLSRSSTDGVSGRESSHLADQPSLLISQNPRRVGLHDAAPKRRRSLFVPSSRSRDRALVPRDDAPLPSPAPSASASISSRKSIKNIFLFQRSNSFTPLR